MGCACSASAENGAVAANPAAETSAQAAPPRGAGSSPEQPWAMPAAPRSVDSFAGPPSDASPGQTPTQATGLLPPGRPPLARRGSGSNPTPNASQTNPLLTPASWAGSAGPATPHHRSPNAKSRRHATPSELRTFAPTMDDALGRAPRTE
uniref:Uncharacterized protein n=1 Tax=Neobodo designis TaxID=312471 RepID=A0A7S1PZX9_NEODS